MQTFFKQTLCTFVLANIYVAAASPSAHSRSQQRRQQHQALARAEQEFPTNVTEGGIYPRGPNSRWSWYDTEETGNPGACGKHIKNSDFAVARPLSEFNFANDCFKQVTLTFEGRTAVATKGPQGKQPEGGRFPRHGTIPTPGVTLSNESGQLRQSGILAASTSAEIESAYRA